MTVTLTQHSDYSINVFKDKKEHMDKVAEILNSQGYIPINLVLAEVEWFYDNLGMDDMYFMMQEPSVVASHVLGIYAASLNGICSNKQHININFDKTDDNSAVFIHTSTPGVSQIEGPQQEQIIDRKYLDISSPSLSYRLESYRSTGTVSKRFATSVRAYFINKCNFVNPSPNETESRDITKVADKIFLAKATKTTLERYQSLMNMAIERAGPVINNYLEETNKEFKVLIAYRQGSTNEYFSGLSDLYHYYGLYSQRKFVEQFSNGITIVSLNFAQPKTQNFDDFVESVEQVSREASLLYCIPNTPLQNLFKKGVLSLQETIYAYVCWLFSQHFLNRLGNEYSSLNAILDINNSESQEILNSIKKRLRQETFTSEAILNVIQSQPNMIKILYRHFAVTHYIHTKSNRLQPSRSLVRINEANPLSDSDIENEINAVTKNNSEQLVMNCFHTFNKHVLKTNFYQLTKVALSFRMDPGFLSTIEYPELPYGVFFIVGAEFRGFHVRFQDVSRGGIRIIRSRTHEAYISNMRTLFDENYSLALTQHRKNKDIPEGGSKGTVFLNYENQQKPFVAFEKYVDSILDLILIGETPGIKNKIVDLHKKPEILFFGPDEGSAGYMDWASKHALHRKASFWKAFTTGKSQTMGGIPHDKYAMTTTSVHQYMLGILAKNQVDESNITKFQTGGPDGDLGSNEILISKDKTTSIVDGSGVLHDPNGINREELTRLAEARVMILEFDMSKLGKGGFRVLVEDTNVTLPDGSLVKSGMDFRNNFHLNHLSTATAFVPCGGRPESIDVNNVSKLIDSEGNSRFKYIVEGANLFITQQARISLEKAGAILFKDASANKGGVTSSSLEVLAALALSDSDHKVLMCKNENGEISEFYSDYVKEVSQTIKDNAKNEFECIWRESQKCNTPKCVLTDEISKAIVSMRAHIETTNLWENKQLRESVLSKALPKLLLSKIGLEKLVENIPDQYLKAIFGAKLASEFIYEYGASPSQFAFFEYIKPYFF
ncbi:hypothetical protein BB561_006150 [Smittium simulii]|uniref:NAD-specific glutamate dehydrogenase n=1 Tax=Smittium simulii TaxID=133385 RepID=A0A2T9Y660_9FUNG|nr:hypothetical protein BB561_006150 [Smittium simulii]